jgi:hypothetical protein
MFAQQRCNYSSLSESAADSDVIRIERYEADEVTRYEITSNQLVKHRS